MKSDFPWIIWTLTAMAFVAVVAHQQYHKGIEAGRNQVIAEFVGGREMMTNGATIGRVK